jgi:hypothetical protein
MPRQQDGSVDDDALRHTGRLCHFRIALGAGRAREYQFPFFGLEKSRTIPAFAKALVEIS